MEKHPRAEALKNTKKINSLNFFYEGEIYIYGEFDQSLLRHVVPQFNVLVDERMADKEPEPINIYISSYGGYWHALLEMLRIVKKAKDNGVPIATHVVGHAASAGSLLAVAGSKGHRYIGNAGYHWIHYGNDWIYVETPLQLTRQHEAVQRFHEWSINHYSTHSKFTPGELREEMRDECWMVFPEECIEKGLADKLIEV